MKNIYESYVMLCLRRFSSGVCLGFLLLAALVGCRVNPGKVGYTSERLSIESLDRFVYRHISYLNTESFGRVACNGMIVVDGREAVIFDTPPDDVTSVELIEWVEQRLGCRITAVIPTHFHDDCLGGLEAFHQRGIPSYAEERTIALAREYMVSVPTTVFRDSLQLMVGRREVYVRHFGAGHTQDNVVGYVPASQILFGGCLIKAEGADKGNLGDADVQAWPATVGRIRAAYPDLRVVIPGHGSVGGPELLDFTIALFEQY